MRTPEENAKTVRALLNIGIERGRQEQLKAEGRLRHTAADVELSNGERLALLTVEFGEVGCAIVELHGLADDIHDKNLVDELTQLAAVAVAWLEAREE